MTTIQDLEKKIQDLEKKILYPIDLGLKNSIESTYFQKFNINELNCGLPVFTSAPTYTGRQGEIVLMDDQSSIRRIYTYLNGTWRYVNLT